MREVCRADRPASPREPFFDMREGPSKRRGRSSAEPGADVVEAVLAARETIVAELSRRVAASGFDDVTPAILAGMVAIPTGGMDLADFGRAKGRSKQSASKLVGELRRRGYVEVVASAVDGRAKIVVPTALGLALSDAGRKAGAALAEAAVDVMGDDAGMVAGLLEAFADTWDHPRRG